MEKLLKYIDTNLATSTYGTAYAFNSMVAPGFTRLVNQQFNFVEYDMTSASPVDSRGEAYNLITSTMYLGPKDNPDLGLTREFLRRVAKATEGKDKFISWQITPQVRFEDLS